MAAPPMVIISCGSASMIDAMEPPEIRKPPNTIANRKTMPPIWSMKNHPSKFVQY